MPKKNGVRQMFRIVSPLLIYYAVSYMVSQIVILWFTGRQWPKFLSENPDIGNANMDVLMQKTNELIMEATKKAMEYSNEIMVISAAILLPILSIMFFKDCKRRKACSMQNKKEVSWLKYAAVIGVGIVISIALNNIIMLADVASISASYQETADRFYAADLLVQILGVGILVPISEELIYRGLFYDRLKDMWSVKRAAGFTCLVFGLFHGNIVQAVYAIAFSALFIYVYERFGTLKAPILVHIAANLTSLAATYFGMYQWIFQNVFRVGVVTVVCAMISVSLLIFIHGEGIKCQENAE